jgi:hypothetical protein
MSELLSSVKGRHVERIAKRRGPKRAAIAVAHTILVIAFHILRDEVPFRDLGADYFRSRECRPTEALSPPSPGRAGV